jgi:hypothetical protein
MNGGASAAPAALTSLRSIRVEYGTLLRGASMGLPGRVSLIVLGSGAMAAAPK